MARACACVRATPAGRPPNPPPSSPARPPAPPSSSIWAARPRRPDASASAWQGTQEGGGAPPCAQHGLRRFTDARAAAGSVCCGHRIRCGAPTAQYPSELLRSQAAVTPWRPKGSGDPTIAALDPGGCSAPPEAAAAPWHVGLRLSGLRRRHGTPMAERGRQRDVVASLAPGLAHIFRWRHGPRASLASRYAWGPA